MYRSNPSRTSFLVSFWMCLFVFSATTWAQENKVTKFNEKGVEFEFTKGWKIGSNDSFGSTRLVTVHGPENAIVTMQFTDSSVADSLEEYAEEYTRSAAKAASTVKFVDQEMAKPEKAKFGFRKISAKFTIVLGEGDLSTKVPHVRTFWMKKFENYTCHLVTQVATDNQKLAKEGFERMIKTVKFKPPAENEDN